MRVKEVCLIIDKSDVLNFAKYQQEVEIHDIGIVSDKGIKGEGRCIIKGIPLNFEIFVEIEEVSSKKVYINIKEFRVLKIAIPDLIKNLALNLIINAFTRIEGVAFEKNSIVVDVSKINNSFDISGVNLDNFEIIDIDILDAEIEVKIGNIYISSNDIKL